MKVGRSSIKFNSVYLLDSATAVGPLESLGPLANYFDIHFDNLYINEKTWEKAEGHLQKTVINEVFKKTNLNPKDIDMAYSGDLINQTVISNYTMKQYSIPYFGIYGACSTSMEGLILGGIAIDSNNAKNVLTIVSSHNATAERQFRNPTEYGGAKPESATYTVTGAAAAILTSKKQQIKVESATIGMVIDVGFKNVNDMGSAMAPAALETILQHFSDLERNDEYYDLIVTGDLSKIGYNIVKDIMNESGFKMENYNDCGLMIYDREKQEVFSGGSGCACCGVVTLGYIKENLMQKKLKKVLIVATGALFNPIIIQQKESICCIAHAISLESGE